MFIKVVRTQGGVGLSKMSSADILRTRGVLQMRTSSLFIAKNFSCFKIYGVFARTKGEGVKPMRKEGSIFCKFVRTSFMDGPLSIKLRCYITTLINFRM